MNPNSDDIGVISHKEYYSVLVVSNVKQTGINAISESCWWWTIIENMPQMSIALGTANLCSYSAKTGIHHFNHMSTIQWLKKTRPTTTGFKLCIGTEIIPSPQQTHENVPIRFSLSRDPVKGRSVPDFLVT